jgi:hypothetical protein
VLRKDNGKVDAENHACTSCWFYCDISDLDTFANHINNEHEPVTVDKAKFDKNRKCFRNGGSGSNASGSYSTLYIAARSQYWEMMTIHIIRYVYTINIYLMLLYQKKTFSHYTQSNIKFPHCHSSAYIKYLNFTCFIISFGSLHDKIGEQDKFKAWLL